MFLGGIIGVIILLIYQTKLFTKVNITTYYLLGFSFLYILYHTYKYYEDEIQLKCVISDVDGNRYCVRDRKRKKEAVNLLADVVKKCNEIVDYLHTKHPNDPRIIRLVNNYSSTKIVETLPNSELTAYSENKGEKIAFCLNKYKNNDNKLIDIDTLTFVAFHELSHLMTETIGHQQDFWNNFKFLLENAKEAGLYQPVNYKKNPQNYCGMVITDNPYYDLK